MINFQYARADDVADAVRLIGRDPDAKFIAGGTNLVDLMKMDVEQPTKLIDISRLPLNKIEGTADGGLRIGAMVRNSDLAYHPLVEQRYPVLASAILAGASQQLRNMATTGGNLLQRTRCHYFYDTASACNKRSPGSGCSAIHGHNRMHAILGTSDACIAVHPSDMCVALALLEAKVHVTGPNRASASIAFTEFHRLPGDTPQRDTNLNSRRDHHRGGAAATGLRQKLHLSENPRPARPTRLRWCPLRSALELEGGSIKEARFAFGGVAHKPWRDPQAEAALAGQPPSGGVRGAADIAAARCQGLRAQHVQDRAGTPRHRARAHTSRARQPQSQSNQERSS